MNGATKAMRYITKVLSKPEQRLIEDMSIQGNMYISRKAAALAVAYSSLFRSKTKLTTSHFAAQHGQLFSLITTCWEA